jgi:hypothetical protein
MSASPAVCAAAQWSFSSSLILVQMAAMRIIPIYRLVVHIPIACMFRGRRATEGTNPVKKKFAAALSGVATLAMALSACGSSNDKIDNYAKSVCDQIQPQLQKIQDSNNSIASVSGSGHTSEEVKSTDSAAFQRITDAYKTLANAVTNAGTPPVEDGATLQQNAVKELNDTSSAYVDLKKAVDGLNPGDQLAFAAGLKGVAGQLASLSKGGDDALSRLQSGDVGKAMAKQPGCRKAAGSPSTGSDNPAPSASSSSQVPPTPASSSLPAPVSSASGASGSASPSPSPASASPSGKS